jgi:hypothetical protein
VAARFDELFDNEDDATYRLAKRALAGELTWLEQGIIGMDAYLDPPTEHPTSEREAKPSARVTAAASSD